MSAPLGIPCPECRHQGSIVVQTFKTNGHVRRRRRCTKCKHPYITGEIMMTSCKATGDDDGT
jgi:transcriptional regulator NrdR family protein